MAWRDTAQGLLGGLQRFSQGANGLLFPGLGAAGVDPETARKAQAQAMLQMGAGLLGGQNFGQAYGMGQQAGYEPIEQARRQAALQAQEQDRKADTDYREWQKKQAEEAQERQQKLDYESTRRYNRDRMGRRFDNEAEQKRWEADYELRRQAAQRGPEYAPSYQVVELDDGTIGAFDQRTGAIAPTGKKAAPDKGDVRLVAQTRKEFRSLPSVKDYETTLPLLVSARNAPATPAGDLQLIYTVGKVFDPGSVVREGELQLTKDAQPWLAKMVGEYQKQVTGGATLNPEVREQFLDALNQRVMGYRQAYDRDYQQYADYARRSNIDPVEVVGSHVANAYQKPKGAAPSGVKSYATEAEAEAAFKAGKLMKGQKVIVGGVPGTWQ